MTDSQALRLGQALKNGKREIKRGVCNWTKDRGKHVREERECFPIEENNDLSKGDSLGPLCRLGALAEPP